MGGWSILRVFAHEALNEFPKLCRKYVRNGLRLFVGYLKAQIYQVIALKRRLKAGEMIKCAAYSP